MIRRILNKTRLLPWLKQRMTIRRINQIRQIEEQQVISQYPFSCNSPLTNEEKKKVQDLWGQVVPVTSFKEFEMFKKMYGFDERFFDSSTLRITTLMLNGRFS